MCIRGFAQGQGVDTIIIFKAHSVQGASATAAHNKGVSLEYIPHLADWSADSMFRRFCYKPNYMYCIL